MAEVRTSEGKHELLSTKATRVSLIGPPQNKGMWVKKIQQRVSTLIRHVSQVLSHQISPKQKRVEIA